MEIVFYRVLYKKSRIFLVHGSQSLWQLSEITYLKNILRARMSNKYYTFSDFLIYEFSLNDKPKVYYLINDRLIPYSGILEKLYE